MAVQFTKRKCPNCARTLKEFNKLAKTIHTNQATEAFVTETRIVNVGKLEAKPTYTTR